MSNTSNDTDLARQLADVARALMRRATTAQTLDKITELAVHTLGGCMSAGISLLEHGSGVRTYAATSELAQGCDQAQTMIGEGSCLSSSTGRRTGARTGWDVHYSPDLAEDQTWPLFAARAVELGARSLASFRLFTEEDTYGALNLYSTEPQAFDEADREVGLIFASHAAIALAAAKYDANLLQALSTRQSIGEAIGVLMARHNVTSEQAFELLRNVSQNSNTKLHSVADYVATAGELPDQ